MCGKFFYRISYRQFYCGNQKQKIGCSYKNQLNILHKYYQLNKTGILKYIKLNAWKYKGKYKERFIRHARLYRIKNPIKYRARYYLYNAVKSGKILKPLICSKCKKKTKIEAHHSDYSKPLEVIWLCRSCHLIADKIMRKK